MVVRQLLQLLQKHVDQHRSYKVFKIIISPILAKKNILKDVYLHIFI